MKSQHANPAREYRAGLPVLAFLFLLVCAAPAGAQIGPRSRPGDRPTEAEMQSIFLDRNLRITARRNADTQRRRNAEEEKRVNEVRQQIILEQVRRDYRAVQELNKSILLSFLSGSPDYRVISKEAVELGRAAARLKQNLALPPPPGDGKPRAQTYAQGLALAPMLRVLDTRVVSFINNPFFQNPNVLDVENTSKARRDLEDIISLCRDIRRNAAQMQKVTYNPR